jgi:hypothetical protein
VYQISIVIYFIFDTPLIRYQKSIEVSNNVWRYRCGTSVKYRCNLADKKVKASSLHASLPSLLCFLSAMESFRRSTPCSAGSHVHHRGSHLWQRWRGRASTALKVEVGSQPPVFGAQPVDFSDETCPEQFLKPNRILNPAPGFAKFQSRESSSDGLTAQS